MQSFTIVLGFCILSGASAISSHQQAHETLHGQSTSQMKIGFKRWLTGIFFSFILAPDQYSLTERLCTDLDSLETMVESPHLEPIGDLEENSITDLMSNNDVIGSTTTEDERVLVIVPEHHFEKQPNNFMCFFTSTVNYNNLLLESIGYEVRVTELFFETFVKLMASHALKILKDPPSDLRLPHLLAAVASGIMRLSSMHENSADILNEALISFISFGSDEKHEEYQHIDRAVSETPEYFVRKRGRDSQQIREGEWNYVKRVIGAFEKFLELHIQSLRRRQHVSVNHMLQEMMSEPKHEFIDMLINHQRDIRPLTMTSIEDLQDDPQFQVAREIIIPQFHVEYYNADVYRDVYPGLVTGTKKQRRAMFNSIISQRPVMANIFSPLYEEKNNGELIYEPLKDRDSNSEKIHHSIVILGRSDLQGYFDVVDPLVGKPLRVKTSTIYELLVHYHYLSVDE